MVLRFSLVRAAIHDTHVRVPSMVAQCPSAGPPRWCRSCAEAESARPRGGHCEEDDIANETLKRPPVHRRGRRCDPMLSDAGPCCAPAHESTAARRRTPSATGRGQTRRPGARAITRARLLGKARRPRAEGTRTSLRVERTGCRWQYQSPRPRAVLPIRSARVRRMGVDVGRAGLPAW